jgi:hypothetical protein
MLYVLKSGLFGSYVEPTASTLPGSDPVALILRIATSNPEIADDCAM